MSHWLFNCDWPSPQLRSHWRRTSSRSFSKAASLSPGRIALLIGGWDITHKSVNSSCQLGRTSRLSQPIVQGWPKNEIMSDVRFILGSDTKVNPILVLDIHTASCNDPSGAFPSPKITISCARWLCSTVELLQLWSQQCWYTLVVSSCYILVLLIASYFICYFKSSLESAAD